MRAGIAPQSVLEAARQAEAAGIDGLFAGDHVTFYGNSNDGLRDRVFAKAPYNSRGARDARNANDNIFSGSGSQMMPSVSPEGGGYAGTITIGVQMG